VIYVIFIITMKSVANTSVDSCLLYQLY